jgi:hypothetical protein
VKRYWELIADNVSKAVWSCFQRSVRQSAMRKPARAFGRVRFRFWIQAVQSNASTYPESVENDPLRTCAVFVPALGSGKDHWTATLRVCFHALQLTKRIERANRNQFEAHEVGLTQR